MVDGKKENRLLVYRQVSPKRQQEPMLNMQDLKQNYKVKILCLKCGTGTQAQLHSFTELRKQVDVWRRAH